MAKLRYFPIGTRINYGGRILEVVPSANNLPLCTGCDFSDFVRRKMGLSKFSCYGHGMTCTSTMRKDKKHVIFKFVEEWKK